MQRVFIIAGCNGAGKTTASYNMLPDILEVKEFVNADEIAKGLSPFQPERVSMAAGRLMLERIHQLMEKKEDFAFETTLATRTYVKLVEEAHQKGYFSTLLFFYLESPELAIQRVAQRVSEGGHHIPEEVIRRRYGRGLKNFFQLFSPLVDDWTFVDTSEKTHKVIAEKGNEKPLIYNQEIWNKLSIKYQANE